MVRLKDADGRTAMDKVWVELSIALDIKMGHFQTFAVLKGKSMRGHHLRLLHDWDGGVIASAINLC
jgi:hypothetical protein